eukprot:jgi/Bigna1/80389/fgenesh1_pg.70_\
MLRRLNIQLASTRIGDGACSDGGNQHGTSRRRRGVGGRDGHRGVTAGPQYEKSLHPVLRLALWAHAQVFGLSEVERRLCQIASCLSAPGLVSHSSYSLSPSLASTPVVTPKQGSVVPMAASGQKTQQHKSASSPFLIIPHYKVGHRHARSIPPAQPEFARRFFRCEDEDEEEEVRPPRVESDGRRRRRRRNGEAIRVDQDDDNDDDDDGGEKNDDAGVLKIIEDGFLQRYGELVLLSDPVTFKGNLEVSIKRCSGAEALNSVWVEVTAD